MKVAVVQMCSTRDPFENLQVVDAFVQEAHAQGAELVCFPENVFYRGPKRFENWSREEIYLSFEKGRLRVDSTFSGLLREYLESWPIAVSLGSVLERGEEKPFNTHLFWDPVRGKLECYRKVHLFKFVGKKATYLEERDYLRGESLRSVEYLKAKIALSICFDLRFPELYRRLVLQEGANLLLVPSAFADETGEAHWEVLLRARAIENQSYVVAAAQWGGHEDSRGQQCLCHGHALVVDPWGKILAELPSRGDGLGIAELPLASLEDLRRRLPVLDLAVLAANAAR